MLDLGWGRFAIVGISHRTHRVKEVEQRLRARPIHKKGSLWTVNRPMQQDLLLGYRRRLSTMQCQGKPVSSPEHPSGKLHQYLSVWILGQVLPISEAFLTLPCANEPSELHSSQRLAQEMQESPSKNCPWMAGRSKSHQESSVWQKAKSQPSTARVLNSHHESHDMFSPKGEAVN